MCPISWLDMLRVLENHYTRMKVTKVLQECKPLGWLKCNTDGASRGNPGLSSYAFCLRVEKGDVKYAKRGIIENTTNIVAEARAILETSKHNQIIIQTNSIIMCKVLEDKWKIL